MRNCSECDKDISKRGHRASMCEECHHKHLLILFKRNNKLKPLRMNKELHQWWKEMQQLTLNDIRGMVGIYQIGLKHEWGYKERFNLKTRIKWSQRLFNEQLVSPDNGFLWDSENMQKASMFETRQINWHKAENGWVNFYDNGLLTLSTSLFFDREERGDVIRTLRDIYHSWRHGYAIPV